MFLRFGILIVLGITFYILLVGRFRRERDVELFVCFLFDVLFFCGIEGVYFFFGLLFFIVVFLVFEEFLMWFIRLIIDLKFGCDFFLCFGSEFDFNGVLVIIFIGLIGLMFGDKYKFWFIFWWCFESVNGCLLFFVLFLLIKLFIDNVFCCLEVKFKFIIIKFLLIW